MINTIIFDIGRVLVDWEWESFLSKSFTDEDTIHIVGKHFFENPLLVEFDRGVLSTEEVLNQCISSAPEYAKEIRIAFDNIGECVKQRDFAIPWIKNLKKEGYKILFLSNYSRHLRNSNPNALSFINYMDGGIFSCDVKMVKPDRNIYEKIIDKYNLIPKECIFVDDNIDNIRTANEIGIHGIQYITHEQVVAEMKKLLQL